MEFFVVVLSWIPSRDSEKAEYSKLLLAALEQFRFKGTLPWYDSALKKQTDLQYHEKITSFKHYACNNVLQKL